MVLLRGVRRPVAAVLLVCFAATMVLVLASCSAGGRDPDRRLSTAAPPSQPVEPAGTWDARRVLNVLARAGLPLRNPAVQDTDSDPNHLLGRAGGYLSRASFDVPGGTPDGQPGDVQRGGVVEVWPDAAAAQQRSAYVARIEGAAPVAGTEYEYRRGNVLVRISGLVDSKTAGRFGAVVEQLAP